MREVSVDTAAEMIEGGAYALDVREREEFAGGHVPGAVNIPMGQFTGRLDELDRDRPVVVICRSGNRSDAMTDVLRAAGFDAVNMVGGTLEWIEAGRPVEHPRASALTVRVIETPSLGDRSYLVHDGRVALVVDPQRDIDRVLDVLEADGVRLTHVFETHIHNDYVTGGFALAQATGAAYHVNAEDEVSFQRTPVRDGDVVEVGERMRVRVLATPGHTFTHLSYALAERSGAGETAARLVSDFASTLKEGEAAAKAAMVGQAGPHTLVQALTQTELAVETAVTVRDKVVEAYKEILRMPV